MTIDAAGVMGSQVDGVAIVTTLADYGSKLDAARAGGQRVGVVLTMGALHAGHASLIRRAADECDIVAVSVFVNPTQFTEVSDLLNYPRTLESDVALAAEAGASLVLAPSVEEVYPGWPDTAHTSVTVGALGRRWEGESRPGHFDGMATVVTKLLSASGPCRAYFGEKDFQQLAIVRMVMADLSLPVEVVGCATDREADGLARSSRNVRLTPAGRQAATCVGEALRAGIKACAAGVGPSAITTAMASVVAHEPLAVLDYAALVDAVTLEPAERTDDGRPLRLVIAVAIDGVRLIDNCDPREPW